MKLRKSARGNKQNKTKQNERKKESRAKKGKRTKKDVLISIFDHWTSRWVEYKESKRKKIQRKE